MSEPVGPSLARLVPVVGFGGALGALGRHGLAQLVVATPGELPLATLLVNLVGCFALGLLIARSADGSIERAFLGTGVLGGFTTFSAFALETDRLLDRAPATAVLYVGLSLLLGLGAAALGLRVVERVR